MFRIGQGFDIHRLEEGAQPLVLGGVRIEHSKGLVAHSDGDALLHAITDALLGALALGDIGQHFPDTDPQYQGKDSLYFLQEAYSLIQKKGFRIVNLDSSVILQKPKLAPHVVAMRKNIASTLGLEIDCVSVKAKTHEKVDAAGEERAVVVHASVLLEKVS